MMSQTAPQRATHAGGTTPELELIRERWRDHAGDLAFTWETHRVRPEALFERPEAAVFWGTAGEVEIGLGVASEIYIPGALDTAPGARFSQIRTWAQSQLESCLELAEPGVLEAKVRAYGGLAFLSGRALRAPWAPFGDARFLIPRFRYRATASSCSLTLYVRQDERAQLASWLERAAEFRRSLISEPTIAALEGHTEVVPPSAAETEAWRAQVQGILDGVVAGAWTKVVAARTVRLAFETPICLSETLGALGQGHSDCIRFCFRFEGHAFVGATPERLIQKQHRAIQTEAIAGTFRLGAAEFATELLRSPKEHLEHAPVVEAITEQLGPLCSELTYSAQPDLKTLPHLLHLRTPISGVLRAEHHVLELVALLHPTPAVGGTPRAAALEWIAREEDFDRGWYAAPVGWFDANGDGEFGVALRSGVVNGAGAQLFAGVGIVAGSEAATEYAETQLKLRSLTAALRVYAEPPQGD